MSIKQISVFLENKPGTLKKMTGVLAAKKVDMRALSLAETKDFGIARIIVDDVWLLKSLMSPADWTSCSPSSPKRRSTLSICTPSWAAAMSRALI